jgi:hypothetical protein
MQNIHHPNKKMNLSCAVNRSRRAHGAASTPFSRAIGSILFPKCVLNCCRVMLLVSVFGTLVACVDRPRNQVSTNAPAELRADTSAVSRTEAQAIKREAFSQLQPLIRRFDRKKMAYEISEQRYLEKLYVWTLTFSMLELRSNPGTFAGDLPEHEVFPFSDFAESAENLLSDLTVYLNRYAEDSDPELEMLVQKKNEASSAVLLSFPGSGCSLQDAVVAMRSADFQAVVNASNPKLAELGMIGGKHVVDTLGVAVGKAINFLDAIFKSQRK